MRYQKFVIEEYRGIHSPIEFNLDRESIFPLIGVNECGKTTILEALLAFDYTADKQNGGRHLHDVENLYSLDPCHPRITAHVEIDHIDLVARLGALAEEPMYVQHLKTVQLVVENAAIFGDDVMQEFSAQVDGYLKRNGVETSDEEVDDEDDSPAEGELEKVRQLRKRVRKYEKICRVIDRLPSLPSHTLVITRNLGSKKMYSMSGVPELQATLQHSLAKIIVRDLDFILYFDDFRHDVPTRIPIAKSGDDEWTRILETLFSKTHEQLSLGQLPTMDERKRQSALAKVERHLNKTLTSQWEKFHLEERSSLYIRLKYSAEKEPMIAFDVRETAENEDEYFFNIKDRSKGFFWFFNFVMRLEFNPKMHSGDGQIIYLLDEPGSYLHSRAQDQLCSKLVDLSRSSKVFYCTHSHHLLDPHRIPFCSIRIVEKDELKSITVRRVYDHSTERRLDAAFQPVFEALQVRPAAIDIDRKQVLIVEGICDFLAFDMFKPSDSTAIVPGVNAHSIQYHISWLLAWGVDYRALWDNDKEGRAKRDEAETHFGKEEADRRFRLLPLPAGKRKRLLEDLFDDNDLAMMRSELQLPGNTKFSKTIIAMYYSSDRERIMAKVSQATSDAFAEVYNSLWT